MCNSSVQFILKCDFSILRDYFIVYGQNVYCKQFMYHVAFEFLNCNWLRPPEDGANSTETCCGNKTVMVYIILKYILLDNEDTLQRDGRC